MSGCFFISFIYSLWMSKFSMCFVLFFVFQCLDKSMCGQLCLPHKHVVNKFLFLKIHPKFNSFLRYLGISILNLIHMPQSF